MIGHVLVVDPVVTNRIVMKARLASAHYGVTCCETVEAAVRASEKINPDFVFIDANLGLSALANLRWAINKTPDGHHVPIVSIGNTSDGHTLSEVLVHGGQDLMQWPIDSELMRARLRSMMRQTQFLKDLRTRGMDMPSVSDHISSIVAPKPIMVVARTNGRATAWAAKMQSHMVCHRVMASSYAGILDPKRRVVDGTVYLLVADPASEPEDILHILSTLKTHSKGGTAHYLAVFPNSATLQAAAALDMGAADIVFADRHEGDIAARLGALSSLSAEISGLNAVLDDGLRNSVFDPLTGLHNRRYSDYNLARMAGEAQMHEKPLAVMIFDIDHFKQINDMHGHLTGDQVLVRIADKLRNQLKESEILARIGGEEFLAVLPCTDPQDAIKAANSVRRAIEEMEFSARTGDEPFKVTVSVGISTSDGTQSPMAMIEQADDALYRAKSDGRNRARLSRSRVAA
jgi:two-component system cell cycle response regulator